MNNKDLLPKAKQELIKLRENATSIEQQQLVGKVDVLNGANVHECIYGTLTGDCWGKRALELISTCAQPPYYRPVDLSTQDTITFWVEGYGARKVFTALEQALWRERDLTIALVKEVFCSQGTLL